MSDMDNVSLHFLQYNNQLPTRGNNVTQQVWVPDADFVWKLVDVVSENVQTGWLEVSEDDGLKTTRIAASKTVDAAESDLHLLENICSLTLVHEASVLDLLRRRYYSDRIYTMASDVLLSINPYKFMDGLFDNPSNYVDISSEQHGTGSVVTQEPHIFRFGNAVFQELTSGLRRGVGHSSSQSIIISGECGAGKTESAKLLLEYFIAANAEMTKQNNNKHHSRSGEASSIEISDGLLESNIIFESFGNAKVVANDNASRFGRFTKLGYDMDGLLVAATNEVLLLERSRLVTVGKDERNYHVFYQLIQGIQSSRPELVDRLGLRRVEDFLILTGGKCTKLEDENDDANEFESLCAALETVGCSEVELDRLFELLACLLHLGNVAMVSKTVKVRLECSTFPLVDIARLLGVGEPALVNCLTTQLMTVANRRAIPYDSGSPDNVRNNVASLVKYIYSGIFSWLNRKVNQSLCHQAAAHGKVVSNFIGMLDIFGFENVESNSFEQLCINYAVERLSHQFNEYVFTSEQEEFTREGLKWSPISFQSNQAVLDLLAKKPTGLFSIIEEQSMLNRAPDDKALLSAFNSAHAASKTLYERSRFGADKFIVRHAAGAVTYNVTGFLVKNSDTMHPTLQQLISTSTNRFLVAVVSEGAHNVNADEPGFIPDIALFNAGGSGAYGKKGSVSTAKRSSTASSSTVFGGFREQLNSVLAATGSTRQHFLKCFKPNPHKQQGCFDSSFMMHQLQYNGIIPMACKEVSGFSSRIGFRQFYLQFHSLFPQSLRSTNDDAAFKTASTATALRYLSSDSFQIGKSKLFMKSGCLPHLMASARLLERVVIRLQYAFRRRQRLRRADLRPDQSTMSSVVTAAMKRAKEEAPVPFHELNPLVVTVDKVSNKTPEDPKRGANKFEAAAAKVVAVNDAKKKLDSRTKLNLTGRVPTFKMAAGENDKMSTLVAKLSADTKVVSPSELTKSMKDPRDKGFGRPPPKGTFPISLKSMTSRQNSEAVKEELKSEAAEGLVELAVAFDSPVIVESPEHRIPQQKVENKMHPVNLPAPLSIQLDRSHPNSSDGAFNAGADSATFFEKKMSNASVFTDDGDEESRLTVPLAPLRDSPISIAIAPSHVRSKEGFEINDQEEEDVHVKTVHHKAPLSPSAKFTQAKVLNDEPFSLAVPPAPKLELEMDSLYDNSNIYADTADDFLSPASFSAHEMSSPDIRAVRPDRKSARAIQSNSAFKTPRVVDHNTPEKGERFRSPRRISSYTTYVDLRAPEIAALDRKLTTSGMGNFVATRLRNKLLMIRLHNFHDACRDGNLARIKEVMDSFAELLDVLDYSNGYMSACEAAICGNQLEVLRVLAPARQEIWWENNHGNTLLHFAMDSGASYPILVHLADRLSLKSYPEASSSSSSSLEEPKTLKSGWLYKQNANRKWQLRFVVLSSDSLRYFTSADDKEPCDVFLLDKSRQNAIFSRAPLEAGFIVTIIMKHGHLSETKRRTSICFKAPGEKELKDWIRYLSLVCSPDNFREAAVSIVHILARQEHLSTVDDSGNTLLHRLCAAKSASVNSANTSLSNVVTSTTTAMNSIADAAWLLANGCSINAQNGEGKTALHLVTASSQFLLSAFLQKHGADVSILDHQGQPAVDLVNGQARNPLFGGGSPETLLPKIRPSKMLYGFTYLVCHFRQLGATSTSRESSGGLMGKLVNSFSVDTLDPSVSLWLALYDVNNNLMEPVQELIGPVFREEENLWWGKTWQLNTPLESMSDSAVLVCKLRVKHGRSGLFKDLCWSFYQLDKEHVDSSSITLRFYKGNFDLKSIAWGRTDFNGAFLEVDLTLNRLMEEEKILPPPPAPRLARKRSITGHHRTPQQPELHATTVASPSVSIDGIDGSSHKKSLLSTGDQLRIRSPTTEEASSQRVKGLPPPRRRVSTNAPQPIITNSDVIPGSANAAAEEDGGSSSVSSPQDHIPPPSGAVNSSPRPLVARLQQKLTKTFSFFSDNSPASVSTSSGQRAPFSQTSPGTSSPRRASGLSPLEISSAVEQVSTVGFVEGTEPAVRFLMRIPEGVGPGTAIVNLGGKKGRTLVVPDGVYPGDVIVVVTSSQED